MLQQSDPEVAKFLLGQAQKSVHHKWQQYKQMAAMTHPKLLPFDDRSASYHVFFG